MSVDNFIPEVWSATMLETFRNEAVWAGLTNRAYQGEASKGNTVHVTSAVPVTIKDYKAAGRTTKPEKVDTTQVDILVDQEKVFDFLIDDIDRVQAAGSMEEFARSAALGIAEDADSHIAALAVTSGTPFTSSTSVTTGNGAHDLLVDIRRALGKAKTPSGNRVVVINPDFEALLLKADSKLASMDTSGSTEGLRNATIGNLLGFRVVVSNNMPSQDKPQVVAMHESALAFVSQVEKTEAMRAQDSIADRMRGLHVYGAKVIRPLSVQVWTAA
ncbi:hypothetical protein JT358_11600 [Micrococcales bacterium 31B]|nr:hypothetical protein [Micrococcales bacterium 31B]